MSKQALGKGLSDLGLDVLLSNSSWQTDSTWQKLSLDLIDPDSTQPRKHFDQEALEQLASSIKQHGVLQPILVTPSGNRYKLVAGERRFRAACLAGLKTIPAWSRVLEPKDIKIIALVENLQREELSPIEQAVSMQTLIEEHKLTHQSVADVLGSSRSHVTNLLRLLSLESDIQLAISQKLITMGHARCLVGLSSVEQKKYLDLIVARSLSVRQIEELLNRPKEKKQKVYTESCVVKKRGNWYNLRLQTSNNLLVKAIETLINNWKIQ